MMRLRWVRDVLFSLATGWHGHAAVSFVRGRSSPSQARLTAWRLLGIGLLLAMCGGCSQVFWRPDVGGAMRLAAERNQIVVVAYWSALNEDCMKMEEEVFRNRDVVRCLGGTVPVKLSALTNQRFADEYGLIIVPSFVLFAPDGQVLRVAQGYMDESRFRGMVEAARLGM